MRIKRKRAMVALAIVAALGLSACGSSSNDDGGSSGPKLSNKAVDDVVNPSDAKGGTLKMALAGGWGDSFDPGNTYYAYSWNMARNYARSLVMFKPAPGKQSLELVPDTGDRPGQVLRRRQDLDLHDPEGPEDGGRHARSPPRTSRTPSRAPSTARS